MTEIGFCVKISLTNGQTDYFLMKNNKLKTNKPQNDIRDNFWPVASLIQDQYKPFRLNELSCLALAL
ncbi:Uncharacterized protein YR821_1017 [Yersinia ruckeri]|uniref:Uncharacterized protein n=1 Tax=Yersinia ruckeri TaxID=29486 RepID=A0A0A8VER1_YERRU|nr:Uncharacterized protein YR821_1017 [Yersinia ruckeri]CEK26843.1 hypothetical protein CSF007_5380 [Yersinia ruckeri]